MMPITSTAAFLLALAGLSAAPAAAQTEPEVRGVVVDASTGRPLDGAAVNFGPRHTWTDAEGRFRLCRVRNADTELTVRATAFVGDTVRVVPGEAGMRIALRPAVPGKPVSILLRDRPRPQTHPDPVWILDGERVFLFATGCETPPPGIRALDEHPAPDDIDSIQVLRGQEAVARYGPDAEYGVVLITTRKRTP